MSWSRNRAKPRAVKPAFELLEDRVVPSTLTYEQWQKLTFRVDDAIKATITPPVEAMATGVPQNASFGAVIGLPSVFSNTTYRGTGYSVAVIDTGIDYRNSVLGGGFGAGRRVVAGWDFVNNDADPLDDNGHGTHVAGIIGSSSSTYSGVAPNVNLIALKVLDKSGAGSFGNVEKALQWVAANQAKYNIVAVNLSLGYGNYTTNPYTFLEDEFSTLKNKSVFISVAAGNSYYSTGGKQGLDFPAISPNVVSVGAVWGGNFGAVAWGSGARDNSTAVDRVASFSQRYSTLSIMAPGAMITSSYLNGTTKTMAGTSMAAPVIAGAAVLLHQAMDAKGLTANQTTILSAMQRTGVKIVDGDDENDNVTNTGLSFKRLNLAAALDSLGSSSNTAPVLQDIANQTVQTGTSRTLTLSASDPNGSPITFSATLTSAPASQAYQLKQQLGLTYAGSYYTNQWGQNEKWLSSTGSSWYCLLPSGQLRRWAGSMTATMQSANLIATLPVSYYDDPSLLWNAQPGAAPTLKVVGNQLTIIAGANSAPGTYQIQVAASDGVLKSFETFSVTVQVNTAPKITPISDRTIGANRAPTLTINASDAQNDAIRYSAKILGTFAKAPATLVLVGNQLTIHTSPNFIGSFEVQVTASDGKLTSTDTFRVTVPTPTPARRFTAHVNGDTLLDTIFFNADGSWWVSTPKSDGTFVNKQWAKWSVPTAWQTVQFGDFNGDGKIDILGYSPTGVIYVGLSTGTSFSTSQWGVISSSIFWNGYKVEDVNGDGMDDFVVRRTTGVWYVGISTGRAFRTPLTPQ